MELSNTRAAALKFQADNKQAVAIYKEGFEYYYLPASEAINQGKPVIEILTYNG